MKIHVAFVMLLAFAAAPSSGESFQEGGVQSPEVLDQYGGCQVCDFGFEDEGAQEHENDWSEQDDLHEVDDFMTSVDASEYDDEQNIDEDAPEKADPVVLATGELVHPETDFTIDAPGAARLTFERTYRSRSDGRSALGSNWFHNHDIRVLFPTELDTASLPTICRATEQSCAIIRKAGVDEVFFRPTGSSFYIPLVSVGQQLTVTTDALGKPNGASLRTSNGTISSFDASGYITRTQDRFGNFRTYEYTSNVMHDAWKTYCRYSTSLGAGSRFCDVAGAALGLTPPSYRDVEDIDSSTNELGVNNRVMAGYQMLAERAAMYPSFSPGYCQGNHCVPPAFFAKRSDKYQITKMAVDGGNTLRLTRVKNNLGQQMTFSYYGDADWSDERAGLLSNVQVASGFGLYFQYDTPDNHVGEVGVHGAPELTRTGEYFLVSAARSGSMTAAAEARRTTSYDYAWTTGRSQELVSRFTELVDTLMFYDMRTAPLAALMELELARSRAVDNINEIYVNEFDGRPKRLIVSSKYDESINFSGNMMPLVVGTGSFDRVIEQRYGGHERLLAPADYVGPPATFGYAPQGDQLRFSPGALEHLVDGGSDWTGTGPYFAGVATGQPPQEVPDELRNPYLAANRVGDIQAIDAPCSEVARSIIGYSLEATPVYEADNDFTVVRALLDEAALQICNWTRFTDRDQRTTWTGMNFMGLPLVSAKETEDRWLVDERLFNGRGLMIESRWPAYAGRPVHVQTMQDYAEPRQWTLDELRLDGALRATRTYPKGDAIFRDDDDLRDIDFVRTSFSYEKTFAQLARATRTVRSGTTTALVHELKSEFICAPSAPSLRCAPGTAACDRMANFRGLIETIKVRIDAMRTNINCSAGCASDLEGQFVLLTREYTNTLQELEMEYLGTQFKPLETSLTGFSGFESAMAIDVAVQAFLGSTSPLVTNATFKKDFDELAVKLNSSACSTAGSCTKELEKIRSLVATYAGTSEKDRLALRQLLPNSSQQEITALSVGFLSADSKENRKYFFSRIDALRTYANKVKSGYTSKTRLDFLNDALKTVTSALDALNLVDAKLLRELPPFDGDVVNCGRTNPDVVSVGVPGDYRTISMTWAANGLPAKQKLEGGGEFTYEYASSGRGLLSSMSESGMSTLELDEIFDGAPCGSPGLPSSWLRSGACTSASALGLNAEAQAILTAADTLSSTTVIERNALGGITRRTTNGAATIFTRDTWGRTLKETSPAGRVTAYEYGDAEVTAIRRGTGTRQAVSYVVRDAEGRALQECTELVAGACLAYRNLVASIDFSDPDCTDIATTYGLLDVADSATFQLKLTKRSLEGKPMCTADEMGRILETSYDLLGRPTAVLDWNSDERRRVDATEIRFIFDLNGGIVERTTETVGDVGARYLATEKYRRDGLGRVDAHLTAKGQIVNYVHDGASRVVDEKIYARYPLKNDPIFDPPTALLQHRQFVFDTHGATTAIDVNGEYGETREYSRWGTAVRRERTGLGSDYALLDARGQLLWQRHSDGDEVFHATDRRARKSLTIALSQSSGSSDFSTQIDVVAFDADGLPLATVTTALAADGVRRARSASASYDTLGHLTKRTGIDGRLTVFGNNLGGWPLSVESERSPGGAVDTTDYDYAANGRLTSIIDPANEMTTYGINGDGHVTHTEYPNGERRTVDYDSLGRPLGMMTTSGTIVENVYSLDGHLTERLVNGAIYEQYKYDALSRIGEALRVNTIDGGQYKATETYEYDALGRIAHETTSIDGATAVHVYADMDAADTWKRIVDVAVQSPTGGSARSNSYVQAFDRGGRIELLSGNGWSRKFQFRGAVVASVHAEGTRAFDFTSPRNGFMERTQMVAKHGSSSDDRMLMRDGIGHIVYDQRSSNGATPKVRAYGYGDNLQLKEVLVRSGAMPTNVQFAEYSPWQAGPKVKDISAGATSTTWLRDTLGSPLKRTTGGQVAETWERTAGGTLTAHNQQAVRHDADERVEHDGAVDYRFDPLDTLLEIDDGDDVEGYVTGPSGRLLAVMRGATTELFAWDGWNMIGSFNKAGQRNWRAVWAEMNELVRFENKAGEAMVPVLDSRNSIVGGWSKSGQWLGSVDYEESGLRTAASGCGQAGPCEMLSGLPFAFGGGWTNSSGLVYFRHRWYNPKIGQFLSADPLEYRDSYNRFAYAAFDPVNFIDPWGLGIKPERGDRPEGEAGDAAQEQDYPTQEYIRLQEDIVKVPPEVGMIPFLGTAASAIEDGERLYVSLAFEKYTDAGKSAVFLTFDILFLIADFYTLGEASAAVVLLKSEGKAFLNTAIRNTDDLLAASRAPVSKTGLSAAARAADKHQAANRGGNFPSPKGNTSQKNASADAFVQDVLANGTQTVHPSGTLDIRLSDGSGVRYNPDGSFSGFLDPNIPLGTP